MGNTDSLTNSCGSFDIIFVRSKAAVCIFRYMSCIAIIPDGHCGTDYLVSGLF